tara:strand:+ start:34 stop:804 length:771 start_codon:yes stop_codon:yes gene_type:complete
MNKRKSILVTSGSKRLGKHISKFFVMNDWDLILHYNKSKVEAEETANELSQYSKNVKLYHADFTKYKDVENLVKNLLLKEKEWVGLVNNAGLFEYDTGNDFTIENLNRHMSINFSSPAILTQALYKNIIKNQIVKNKNNMVINIIDAKIEGLNPDYYSYTLSKLAMSGLTKMSALSYAPDMRVNAIAPGIILPAENQNEKEFIKSHKKNILNSSATIDDLNLALDFLTNSNSVTGHISLLDGGAHLAPPSRDVALQ